MFLIKFVVCIAWLAWAALWTVTGLATPTDHSSGVWLVTWAIGALMPLLPFIAWSLYRRAS
jgi:hypothetical protein